MSARIPLKLLVDTNVWIDYFCGYRSHHGPALQVVNAAIEQGANLLYLAGCLKDVYYLVAMEQKRNLASDGIELTEGTARAINQIALRSIDAMRDVSSPVPLDLRTIWTARQLEAACPDFEDCLVMAACELAEVDFLVTNDKGLLAKAPVAALSPADMTSYLAVH